MGEPRYVRLDAPCLRHFFSSPWLSVLRCSLFPQRLSVMHSLAVSRSWPPSPARPSAATSWVLDRRSLYILHALMSFRLYPGHAICCWILIPCLCILRTPRFSLSPHLELRFKNANKPRHYFNQALQGQRRTSPLLASPLSHPKGPPPLPLFFHSPLHSARNEHLLEPADENTLRIMIATDNHVGFLERDPVRGPDSFAALEGR